MSVRFSMHTALIFSNLILKGRIPYDKVLNFSLNVAFGPKLEKLYITDQVSSKMFELFLRQ